MSRTVVVNLKREPFDVYIGRQGKGEDGYFGNPFILNDPYDPTARERVLQEYRAYFYERVKRDDEFARRVQELRGKRLGCFCKPLPCHGDVIVAWLESGASE